MIRIEEVYKIYGGHVETVAIENFSANVKKGEIVALSGPSGSGKSTLISIVGGILRPTSGRVYVDGEDITKYSDDELVRYRRDKVGLIYQDFNLVNQFTIFENVALPMLIAGRPRNEIDSRVNNLLERLGVERYKKTFPPYISGGERQRVAIAVALANDPDIILADEPTGNLDKENSKNVLEILVNESKELQKTLLIASHDKYVMDSTDRIIEV